MAIFAALHTKLNNCPLFLRYSSSLAPPWHTLLYRQIQPPRGASTSIKQAFTFQKEAKQESNYVTHSFFHIGDWIVCFLPKDRFHAQV